MRNRPLLASHVTAACTAIC